LRVAGLGALDAEIASAQAWDAGAVGVVEQDGVLGIYVPAPALPAVEGAVRATLPAGVELGAPACVAAEDWSESWKRHLVAVDISPRLRVRPSFVAALPERPGRHELAIEPGQAFGTGAHASTRLALECLDAGFERERAAARPVPGRVLDVGTGSGVLALAAAALGARVALGFDLDPLAAPAARTAARANGLSDRTAFFTGSIAALAGVRSPPQRAGADPARFDLIVANLLRSELLPIASQIAARVRPGGWLVLAGLLEADGDAVRAALQPGGLREDLRRVRRDADGAAWLGLALRRR